MHDRAIGGRVLETGSGRPGPASGRETGRPDMKLKPADISPGSHPLLLVSAFRARERPHRVIGHIESIFAEPEMDGFRKPVATT